MIKNGYFYLCYARVNDRATPPRRATLNATGHDLATIQGAWIPPFSCVRFDTGLQFFLEPGEWFTVVNRSSVFVDKGLIVNPSPIDSDYRWQMNYDQRIGGPVVSYKKDRPVPLTLKILVRNVGILPRLIHAGERIAQIVVPWVHSSVVASIPAFSVYPPRIVQDADGWSSDREGGI